MGLSVVISGIGERLPAPGDPLRSLESLSWWDKGPETAAGGSTQAAERLAG